MVLTFPKTRRAELEGPSTVDMSHTSPFLSGSSMATRDWHKCQHGAGQGVGRPSGWTPSSPGHRREPQQQSRARQAVPIMNFYFQDPSSLPSGELPSCFYGRYVCVFPPPSKTKQDSGDMGWGWHWCLRVVDMDVCRDGTDEPNQFPTRDHSNPTVPLGEPARRPESPGRETGAVGTGLPASTLGRLSGPTTESGSTLMLPPPWGGNSSII